MPACGPWRSSTLQDSPTRTATRKPLAQTQRPSCGRFRTGKSGNYYSGSCLVLTRSSRAPHGPAAASCWPASHRERVGRYVPDHPMNDPALKPQNRCLWLQLRTQAFIAERLGHWSRSTAQDRSHGGVEVEQLEQLAVEPKKQETILLLKVQPIMRN